ncbi:MAG: hypothetical protein JWO79_1263, partial [Actinomycetia bacterium]|nr:hypothetical protein [Actinomycetes bacterium]
MDVTVRAGRAGTVLVGPRPAAPAGTGVVLVTGAEIYVDPTAPDDLPFALVHDVDEAEAAMHAVYGSAVAATVLEVAESRTNTLAPLADLPGLAAELVRRIGLVRWLETHSPDELPQGLLDLEFGSASCALDDLLADPEREDAEARLLRRAGLAVRLSRRLRDSGGPPAPSGLAALLVDALPWVHRVVPYSSPDFDDVLHEVELAAALRELAPDGAVFDWDALAEAPGVGGRELATSRSRSAGRPRDLEVPRRASVDWWQVPRGVLRTAEDTVEWQLTDGATRVAVTVAATPGAPAAALAFRLFAGDLPVPIAVGALQLTDDGAAFRGSAPLHGTPAGELTLDVHDPTARRPARLGADRAIAQAVRWAARGIT